MRSTRALGSCLAVFTGLVCITSVYAQKPDTRFYIAPMATLGFFDDGHLGDNQLSFDRTTGFMVAAGKPLNKYFDAEAYFFRFHGVDTDSSQGGSEDILGYGIEGLIFPVPDSFPVYALVGIGAGDYDFNGGLKTALGGTGDGDPNFVDYGVGVEWPLSFIHYGLKLRAEFRRRHLHLQVTNNRDGKFNDNFLSVGLVIPIGAPPEQAQPVAPAAAPLAAAPADSDNDGVYDNNDNCPDTPPGTAVDASGCPARQAQTIVLKGVTFEFNSANLTRQATDRLDNVVNALMAAGNIDVRLEGYTDSIGSAFYNQALSQRRVDSVKRYLVEHGIDADRLTTKGFGESNPVAPNTNPDGSDNPAGRARNRRVELHVVK